jgi:hypothetical protein
VPAPVFKASVSADSDSGASVSDGGMAQLSYIFKTSTFKIITETNFFFKVNSLKKKLANSRDPVPVKKSSIQK